MKLTNEFTVGAPLERAWETLLNLERVAGFLPGAKIEQGAEGGVYHGSMRVKVGPMVVNYRGTAQLVMVDEENHIAHIAVQGKATNGQGTAAATIRNRLVPHENGTHVIAETDLDITGRPAQFGRGIIEEVASRILDDFAGTFETYLLSGEEESSPQADAAPTSAPPIREEAALDVGSILFKIPVVQRGLAALVGLALVLLLLRLRQR